MARSAQTATDYRGAKPRGRLESYWTGWFQVALGPGNYKQARTLAREKAKLEELLS